MPLAWIDNEVALHHRGVTLYTLHRNDDPNDATLDYHYATQSGASHGDGSDTIFDIRDFPGAETLKPEEHPEALRRMIDEMFEKGEESFLFPHLGDDRVPEPDDRAPVGVLHKTTVVVWSKDPDAGLVAARNLCAMLPEAEVFRTGVVPVPYPEADPEWTETCDGKFRGSP